MYWQHVIIVMVKILLISTFYLSRHPKTTILPWASYSGSGAHFWVPLDSGCCLPQTDTETLFWNRFQLWMEWPLELWCAFVPCPEFKYKCSLNTERDTWHKADSLGSKQATTLKYFKDFSNNFLFSHTAGLFHLLAFTHPWRLVVCF